jgi:hypothetical protein
MNQNLHQLAMLAALCLALPGCGTQDSPRPAAGGLRSKIGYQCTVQFRRDALGAASTIPVPPLTNSMNGADVSLSGKLVDVKGDWLVIERAIGTQNQTLETWVPIHSVLLLEWSGR